jgi:uncharacterized protein YecE (DUF72 family)
MAEIHIGTSGWHYAHWKGSFYPRDMKPGDFLTYYGAHFSAAEINNTFYRLPARETLADWREITPRGFVFACKASRYITHMKKLKDPHDSIGHFMEVIDALGTKLGPILFQLPPGWHVDVDRLEAFLEALPQGRRYAFEFRDETWFTDEIYDVLARREAAFCIYHLAGRRSPVEVTGNLVYVRLHGPGDAYEGSYNGRTLFGWVRRFLRWRDEGRDVFCFFDNDEKGYAARDAMRIQEMLSGR